MVTKTIYPLVLLGSLQSAACNGATPTTANGTQKIPIPASKPSDAVQVPADFVAMGFDGEFINNYTNTFSTNLVESVASRMGAQIKLRIGGTSSDRASYDPKLNSENVAVQCNKTAAHGKSCPNGPSTTFSAGQLYFDAFKAFPNASMTVQAPMSKDTDFDASAHFVKLMYEALGADRCNAIALGNEIENYDGNGGDPSKYTKDAQTLEATIIHVLGWKGDQTRIFEVLDLGSGSMTAIGNGDFKKFWPVSAAFDKGLNSNGNVKQAAAHWYQIEGHQGRHNLQGSLMNHTAIITKGKPYIDAVTYLRKNDPNIPFMLTETGGQIGGGTPDLGPTFGSTLWSVDWQMYCMSQGISRIAATMRPDASHSLWIPEDDMTAQNHKGQAVRAPYYAQPFVADFVGPSHSGPSVKEVDLNNPHFTAYAAYEGDDLARIALVDLLEWSAANGTRPVRTVSLPVPGGKKVRVARLEAEAGAWSGGMDYDGKNITYAGQHWSKINNGMVQPAQQSFESPDVQQGEVTISLKASEAVIVHLD